MTSTRKTIEKPLVIQSASSKNWNNKSDSAPTIGQDAQTWKNVLAQVSK